MTVAVLVMLAGQSRRMGGPNKLLLPWNGMTLAERAIRLARDTSVGPVLVVTGRDAEAVGDIARRLDMPTVHNPQAEDGFGTSLAIGFSSLVAMDGIAGAMVLLGDMPLLTKAHLRELDAMFRAQTEPAIVRAANGSRPGNPAIIPKALFGDFVTLTGEETGRPAIARSGLPTLLVDIGPAALADIDTVADYDALRGG